MEEEKLLMVVRVPSDPKSYLERLDSWLGIGILLRELIFTERTRCRWQFVFRKAG